MGAGCRTDHQDRHLDLDSGSTQSDGESEIIDRQQWTHSHKAVTDPRAGALRSPGVQFPANYLASLQARGRDFSAGALYNLPSVIEISVSEGPPVRPHQL